jgi:multidrug transporter EmrE-like cation transporter
MFGAGIVLDYLLTKYMAAVADKKKFLASGLSMIFTIVNFGLLAFLLKDLDNSILNIGSYAIGNGVGTFLCLRK